MGPYLYFVFIGIFQFVNDFQGLKGRPNCKIYFDPSKGFNEGCLSLVAFSKNGAGIGADQELLVQYPSSYDHERQYEFKDSFAARFKGPMDKFVKVPASPANGEEANNSQEVFETPPKQAKLTAGGSGAQSAGAASSSGNTTPPGTADPPAKRPKLEPAAPPGTATATPPGTQKEETLFSFTSPFQVAFQKVVEGENSSYQFKSAETTTRRLPKHFLLATFTDGRLKETGSNTPLSPNQYPFEVEASTLVMDAKTENIDTLQKIFKDHFPKAIKLLGYEKLEKVGTVKAKGMKADQSWAIEFPGDKGQSTVALLRSIGPYKSIVPLWGLIYDEKARFFFSVTCRVGGCDTATRQAPQNIDR